MYALTLLILTSNLMAVKTIDVFTFTLPAAIILYPFAFVVGDLITEFHGFRATRRAVISALLFNALFVGLLALAAIMPPSQHFLDDEAFRTICLAAPRIVIASFTAFLVSGVLNGWIFAFLKKHAHPLLTRSSVSTLVGVVLDSTIFITIAFAGKYPIGNMILGQILAKLIVGVGIGVPLTWVLVHTRLQPCMKPDTAGAVSVHYVIIPPCAHSKTSSSPAAPVSSAPTSSGTSSPKPVTPDASSTSTR